MLIVVVSAFPILYDASFTSYRGIKSRVSVNVKWKQIGDIVGVSDIGRYATKQLSTQSM